MSTADRQFFDNSLKHFIVELFLKGFFERLVAKDHIWEELEARELRRQKKDKTGKLKSIYLNHEAMVQGVGEMSKFLTLAFTEVGSGNLKHKQSSGFNLLIKDYFRIHETGSNKDMVDTKTKKVTNAKAVPQKTGQDYTAYLPRHCGSRRWKLRYFRN